ncbi:MAG: glycosyltransferase [Bacteroidia bacterium]|nr:glycosyltransferase [Bacteroidia bacterium]
MSEKVLFIANYFPPMGGPGVTRSIHFVNHLGKFGYEPIVLTLDEESIRQGPHKMDPGLLNQIPADLKIVRTPAGKMPGWARLLQKARLFRVAWFLAFPKFFEPSSRWPFEALPVAEKLIKEENIKLVYTSSGPFSALLLGFILKTRNPELKWVADLRDPWTDGYMWKWPGKLQYNWSRRMEKKWLNGADKLVVNTPEVKKLYLKRDLLPAEKMEVITNGF